MGKPSIGSLTEPVARCGLPRLLPPGLLWACLWKDFRYVFLKEAEGASRPLTPITALCGSVWAEVRSATVSKKLCIRNQEFCDPPAGGSPCVTTAHGRHSKDRSQAAGCESTKKGTKVTHLACDAQSSLCRLAQTPSLRIAWLRQSFTVRDASNTC